MNKFYKIFLLALLCLPGQHCFGAEHGSIFDFAIARGWLMATSQPYQMKLKALDDYNKAHPTETWKFVAAGVAGAAVAAGVMYYNRHMTEDHRSEIHLYDVAIGQGLADLAVIRKRNEEPQMQVKAMQGHPAFAANKGPASVLLSMLRSQAEIKQDKRRADTIKSRLTEFKKIRRAQRAIVAAINGSLFAGTFLVAAPVSLVALNIIFEKPESKALRRDCMNMVESEVLRVQIEGLTAKLARLQK